MSFALEKLWIKNLKITTGLVNANTTGMLLKSCECSRLPMDKLATLISNSQRWKKRMMSSSTLTKPEP
ncbi:hypothetical protein [Moraxella ovis]|uniref:hypothetical protein n=1 Tax=Moraxella ovis TaxID=29433 RepID=UPI00273ABEC5|nr:hypothetical protein [Moraxella ovis]